jgi:hypothetical protein
MIFHKFDKIYYIANKKAENFLLFCWFGGEAGFRTRTVFIIYQQFDLSFHKEIILVFYLTVVYILHNNIVYLQENAGYDFQYIIRNTCGKV